MSSELGFETASWGRRIVALLVDWLVSSLVVVAFVGWDAYSAPGGTAQLIVLPVFAVEAALFTYLLGGSFGKIATRLRTVPADGRMRPVNPLLLLVRQVLVLLVIPPVVFKPDGRGLHDLVAGTATVTLPVYRGLIGAAYPGKPGSA